MYKILFADDDSKIRETVFDYLTANGFETMLAKDGEQAVEEAELCEKCRVAVYNSGSNVAEEDKPHIWEELYSGDKVRNRESDSTGMGLAVSRVILENHKFTYGFQNEENGVAFWFHE